MSTQDNTGIAHVRDRDDLSGVETTGHEWDGIKELNNPLPRWWLWTFYACIVWALGYTVLYPAWPLVSQATGGVLGYSSRADFAQTMASVTESNAPILRAIAETPMADILADADLTRFATAGGASAFKVNCSQCHGTGAQGSAGYPNLNDDSWIWGGSIDDIYATIAHGVRSPTDPDTRYNFMPNFGTDELLDRDSIRLLAAYVASLSGMEGGVTSPEAETLFADNCASCHGERGIGMAEVGGPSLADQLWLYEGSLAAITEQINQPRHGVMQAWSEKLDDVTIKQLAVYVHGLGGGQ
ncbi:MAG: cytochrome-c oxidase, cbb3-type subunit III [Candidatus Devosia phytovorans]|uniref:Cbb3-type cytochrome c oxidase subunit n=1 Tax=Candidatus Devosia phytovorans TaxID=3121372 RepID=A0AAJ6B1U3_9HYPH|nr:cytochrome-c oxidase, cbb3-type subunit III [Devosia sp.]WEK06667.1 MAG: cytochrome-c oxidase, cbb3-type subunit III [Devosia sp.]